MKIALAFFASLCILCGHLFAAPAKPNLIFILSDDLAQGDLGCYGQKLIQTPNLDRMAREGTRFTQAYCGTTVCAPSRTSLMTGMHMGHSPIRANREVQPEGQKPLPAGTVTVAQVLKSAGYLRGRMRRGYFSAPGRWAGDLLLGSPCSFTSVWHPFRG